MIERFVTRLFIAFAVGAAVGYLVATLLSQVGLFLL